MKVIERRVVLIKETVIELNDVDCNGCTSAGPYILGTRMEFDIKGIIRNDLGCISAGPELKFSLRQLKMIKMRALLGT